MRKALILAPIVGAELAATALAGCSGRSKQDVRVQLTAFLQHDATADQRNAIEQEVRGLPKVKDVTFETHDQAYARFKEMTNNDDALVGQTRPESLPESFRFTLPGTPTAEAAAVAIRGISGVDDVTATARSLGRGNTTAVIVYLDNDVSAQQRTAIEQKIHGIPVVTKVAFEPGDRAARRLRTACGTNQKLAEMIKTEYVRASYRLKVDAEAVDGSQPASASDLAALQRLAGVSDLAFLPTPVL